jgi:hypothetical protein
MACLGMIVGQVIWCFMTCDAYACASSKPQQLLNSKLEFEAEWP